jgi:hypothetical protein
MSKILVCDHGCYTAFAERLAEEGEVLYFAPFSDRSFPKHGPAMVGSGMKGVERVSSFWTALRELNMDEDTVVFPDVGFWDLACDLRAQGFHVWAAGLGEKLEVQRWRAKETMRELGLPVGKCALVTGMKALREYLSENDDVFVKISGFRGLAETFPSESLAIAEPRLVELELELGGAAEVFPFIVEHKVDAVVEAGYDGYCVNGKFPSTCLTGVEIKDKGYLGAVRDYDKLADPVRVVNDKLAPFLEEAGYAQFFSTEIRVTEDDTPYLIDLTTRCPAPPSALYWAMIENIWEIVEGGARGICVDPVWRSKYGALAIIISDFATERWCPVTVTEEARPWVKWRNYCEIEGQGYIIPQDGIKMSEIGDCLGIGDTVEEAIKNCQENAKGVGGFCVTVYDKAITDALGEIQKAEDAGIEFTDDALPEQKDLIE